ncbi:PHA/PHB synthase family protein [Hyphococcus sp.]|uniref:PHA/PHB synthase family protein n=1 Tax=Hyphococcus sp. TaxID=2038636 RepID=UPI003D0979E0
MDQRTEINSIAAPAPPHPPSFDRAMDAAIGKITGGVSPTALALAYTDWALHLSKSVDVQANLIADAANAYWRFIEYCLRACVDPDCETCIEPEAKDRRFADDLWNTQPFRTYAQGFLLAQEWWAHATAGPPGVDKHHRDVVGFVGRQLLDMASPANFPATNPAIIARTLKEGGRNLQRGYSLWLDDWTRALDATRGADLSDYVLGRDLATTPGEVVYRNELIELIQYEPQTEKTRPEPILITPAWIMKFYILDLSPENSLVGYLVKNGFTVFMISWKNPTAADRDLSLADYRRLGVDAAVRQVASIAPGKLHLVGYCLGGTLAAIAAASMARDGNDRLRSLTLLAAQTDFTEAGELTLFIDEAQVTFLENVMAEQGYLDARQMAGAFQLLRSSDLIWSKMVRSYWHGDAPAMFDLMVWNADATRMPYEMHAEYLRKLFLNNDFAQERYLVEGKPVALRDVRAPIFAVGTEHDHVAPWRSVYKVQAQASADVTFVLTSGGHNVGIVNPPGLRKRRHQIGTHDDLEAYLDPDAWRAAAARHDGSWWPCWLEWLAKRSSVLTAPPDMAPSIAPAPGAYVLER